MISIIIPAYNEEKNIGKLVSYLKENSSSRKIETIVVDGGSTDQTISMAEKAGARVIRSPGKGRAKQMNFGASEAKGDLLYFLHADTLPPKTFMNDIYREIKKGNESGCYRLSFDSDHKVLKLYSWFTRFDVDVFRFGDQSLFATKKIFNKAGGFDENLMVMEDQEIVSRLKDHAQFIIIPKTVSTSARKYEKIGVLKLQMIFSCILSLYYLGASQQMLLHFYQNVLRTDFKMRSEN